MDGNAEAGIQPPTEHLLLLLLLLMQGFDTILSDMLQFTNGINDVRATQQGGSRRMSRPWYSQPPAANAASMHAALCTLPPMANARL
jgi:hypothetical protein